MKFSIFGLPALLTTCLAMAQPCPLPASTVALRLISTDANHYRTSQQTTTTPSGRLMQLLVGQTISLDHAPLHIQAIEIVQVTSGTDLSGPSKKVDEDDQNVRCKAKVAYGSEGVTFKISDGVKIVAEGNEVGVTGLECWLEVGTDGSSV